MEEEEKEEGAACSSIIGCRLASPAQPFSSVTLLKNHSHQAWGAAEGSPLWLV